MIKTNFKSIEDAMQVINPGDKIIKKINNKFAIVRPVFEDGKFHFVEFVYWLDGNRIYCLGSFSYIKATIERWENMPNITKTKWCFNHSENGNPLHWLLKTEDNRKRKQKYRQLKKALFNQN